MAVILSFRLEITFSNWPIAPTTFSRSLWQASSLSFSPEEQGGEEGVGRNNSRVPGLLMELFMGRETCVLSSPPGGRSI